MRTLLVLAAVVLTVAACGRRGSPELPEAAKTAPRAEIYPTDPGGETAPDRAFLLDPVLQ